MICSLFSDSLLVEYAWRSPGLRELIAIPLYMVALLKQTADGALPTTKEGILQAFVEESERDPDKAATLRERLQGFHRIHLQALAIEAHRQNTVALSESLSRGVVSSVQKRLRDDGQISSLEQKEFDPLVPFLQPKSAPVTRRNPLLSELVRFNLC